jgi:hypothetical protein
VPLPTIEDNRGFMQNAWWVRAAAVSSTATETEAAMREAPGASGRRRSLRARCFYAEPAPLKPPDGSGDGLKRFSYSKREEGSRVTSAPLPMRHTRPTRKMPITTNKITPNPTSLIMVPPARMHRSAV